MPETRDFAQRIGVIVVRCGRCNLPECKRQLTELLEDGRRVVRSPRNA